MITLSRFLSILPSDVSTFVLGRNPKSAMEAAHMASEFQALHSWKAKPTYSSRYDRRDENPSYRSDRSEGRKDASSSASGTARGGGRQLFSIRNSQRRRTPALQHQEQPEEKDASSSASGTAGGGGHQLFSIRNSQRRRMPALQHQEQPEAEHRTDNSKAFQKGIKSGQRATPTAVSDQSLATDVGKGPQINALTAQNGSDE